MKLTISIVLFLPIMQRFVIYTDKALRYIFNTPNNSEGYEMECAVTSDLNRYEVEQDRKEREFDRLESDFNKCVGGNLNQHIREYVQGLLERLSEDSRGADNETLFKVEYLEKLPKQVRDEIDSMIQFDQDFLSSIDPDQYLSILRGSALEMAEYFYEEYEPEYPEFWMKLFLSE